MATLNQPQYDAVAVREPGGVDLGRHQRVLDPVDVPDVPRFQAELIPYLEAGGKVLTAIRDTGELSDETEAELRKAAESLPRASADGEEEAAVAV